MCILRYFHATKTIRVHAIGNFETLRNIWNFINVRLWVDVYTLAVDCDVGEIQVSFWMEYLCEIPRVFFPRVYWKLIHWSVWWCAIVLGSSYFLAHDFFLEISTFFSFLACLLQIVNSATVVVSGQTKINCFHLFVGKIQCSIKHGSRKLIW